MNLKDLLDRSQPLPWSEGDNIPWNEPEFSQAMLRWHLDQDNDAASRRITIIERQVHFIHTRILEGRPSSLLDLGCGPGLYLEMLARLGHRGLGIDFSPASIAYARRVAEEKGLPCTYQLADMRIADYGTAAFDAILLLFGEFNVFKPGDIRHILRKAWAALKPGGRLLLEPSPEAHIREMGQAPAGWYTSPGGLFSSRPHMMLEESFWDETRQASTVRYFCVDLASSEMTRYAASYQAYSDEAYRALLTKCGFQAVQFFPALTGDEQPAADLFVILAKK